MRAKRVGIRVPIYLVKEYGGSSKQVLEEGPRGKPTGIAVPQRELKATQGVAASRTIRWLADSRSPGRQRCCLQAYLTAYSSKMFPGKCRVRHLLGVWAYFLSDYIVSGYFDTAYVLRADSINYRRAWLAVSLVKPQGHEISPGIIHSPSPDLAATWSNRRIS